MELLVKETWKCKWQRRERIKGGDVEERSKRVKLKGQVRDQARSTVEVQVNLNKGNKGREQEKGWRIVLALVKVEVTAAAVTTVLTSTVPRVNLIGLLAAACLHQCPSLSVVHPSSLVRLVVWHWHGLRILRTRCISELYCYLAGHSWTNNPVRMLGNH